MSVGATNTRNDGNGVAVEKKSVNVKYHAYIVLSHPSSLYLSSYH